MSKTSIPAGRPAHVPPAQNPIPEVGNFDNTVRRSGEREPDPASWLPENNALFFEVNLVSNEDEYHASKLERPSRQHVRGDIESLNIDTSHCYSDSGGADMIVLTEDLDHNSYMRWIHIQHDQMSLKNLRAYIRRDGQLHKDDAVLADRLLDQVSEKGEERLASRSSLHPMVLQSRSRYEGAEIEATRYCTFANFPYFILRPQSSTDNLPPSTRGLVQTLYRSTSPKVWDQKQVICEVQQRRQEPIKVLQVAQLWTLSFSSGTIITMSADPRKTLLGNSIKISHTLKSTRTGPSMVRVTDPLGRLFFFSLEQCQTWIELMDLMETNFLTDMHYRSEHCDYLLTGDKQIQSSQWVEIIASESKSFIELEVSIKQNYKHLNKRLRYQNGQIVDDSLVVNDLTQIIDVPEIYSHGHANSDAGPSNTRPKPEKDHSRRESVSSGLFSTRFSYLPILMWPTADMEDEEFDEQLELGTDLASTRSKSAKGKMPEKFEALGHTSMTQILERINERISTDSKDGLNDIYLDTQETSFEDVLSLLDLMSQEAKNRDVVPSSQDPNIPEMESEQTLLKDVVNIAEKIVGVFIPVNSSDIFTRKCYGALKGIIQVVRQAYNAYYGSKSVGNNAALTCYTIQDRSHETIYLANHNLRSPTLSISHCARCLSGFPYKTSKHAADHLRRSHFQQDIEPLQEELNHWISNFVPATGQLRCSNLMISLRQCVYLLKQFLVNLIELRDGVHMDGSHKRMRCQLPRSLVDAFQDIITYIICTSKAFEVGDILDIPFERSQIAQNEPVAASRGNTRTQTYNYTAREIAQRAHHAGLRALREARHDLLMMLRTHDFTSSVKYQAVGPDYIMVTILRNLQAGVDCTWKELLRLYEDYSEIMSFKVELAPRRRLFRDLNRVHKELKAIYETTQKQRELFYCIERVLTPTSFRVTSKSRIYLYPLETLITRKCLQFSHDTSSQIVHLRNDAKDLEVQAQLGIEIINDDNGKAIFVFTVVTLIFLPLSFVSSFMGMNTIDIRNQTASQGLFWTISLPLTGGIIVLTLLLTYRYDSMRDWFEKWKAKRFR